MKKVVSILLAISMMAGLTACGGDSATTGAADDANGKKVMNLGSTGYFASETMDPAYGWDGWYMGYNGMTETLFKLDENIAPVPHLALSCESEDYLTWTVELRDDVTFQNGEKMTAEAVKKCFERTYEVNERAREAVAISSIEADGQTLTFHLETENVTFKNDLTDPLWSVYDAENSDFEETLYCTGPYMITEFEPFVETVVVKYEGYWGGEPKLDEAHLITIGDTESLSMALQNGEIDLAVAMPISAISMFENNEAFVVDAVTTTRANRMYFNMNRPAMSDAAVRQAVAMCIDRDGISESLYAGMATASWGLYPDFLPFGGSEGLNLTVDKYDPEGAKAILAEAGWSDSDGDGILDKDGVKLELRSITFASRKELGQMLELLQAELSGVGISLKVDVLESTYDVAASGDFDICLESGVMAPTGNPQYFIDIMLTTGASSNYSYYSNEEVDKLAKELEKTADEDARIALVRQIVQIVMDENPILIYNHQKFTNIYASHVKGFSTHPSEYYLLDVNTDIEK